MPASVRRYLREFLSDARVIENQGLVWKFVLNAIILPRRPQGQRPRLREDLESRAERIAAEDHHPLAGGEASRRRSTRSIRPSWSIGRCATAIRRSKSRIEALAKAGCERILLVPLYPQYAAATSATVCDSAFLTLIKLRDQPALRVVPPYYDDPVYIDALAALDRGRAEAAAVQAGADPRLVPRHPEILCRGGRSLSEPLRGDGAAAAARG